MSELRTDPLLGTKVHIVGGRQSRPNRPATGCPFCVGGLEAPDDYDVHWFLNRWPAMPDDRCEVVLYSPIHDEAFGSLGTDGVRRVIDLWAERTAKLGARDDVESVLIFENRGAEVGATIAHPHGQIYAFDHVPARTRQRFNAGFVPSPGDRSISTVGDWEAWVPYASPYPIAVEIAPTTRIADLPSLDDDNRDQMALILIDVLGRLDRLFDQPLPYMLWINQRPAVDGYDNAWLSIEIVSPWRAAGVTRYIAAAEIATGEYFNPVVPEDIASQLRAATPPLGDTT